MRNQVEFDPSKKCSKIINPARGLGEHFKLLGTIFDVALSMTPCIEDVLQRVRPEVRAILRLRHLYSVNTMLDRYKAHVWGIMEYSNGVLILATPGQLRRLDKLQRWFFRDLGISAQDASTLRRNIGLLYFLQKESLESAVPLSAMPSH